MIPGLGVQNWPEGFRDMFCACISVGFQKAPCSFDQ